MSQTSGCSRPELTMGSSYSAQHSSSLLSTPGPFSSFHSMLGHWAVSHMAWLHLPSACWWLPDSYSFLDLHGKFLASRTCQLNVPQVLKLQHLPYSVSPHKLLSPQFLPSLVKLVMPCSCTPCQRSWIQATVDPLLSFALSLAKHQTASSLPFYLLNLSEIHPFFLTLSLLSPGLVNTSLPSGFLPLTSHSLLYLYYYLCELSNMTLNLSGFLA